MTSRRFISGNWLLKLVNQGFPALEVQSALGESFVVTEYERKLQVRTEGVGGHAAFPEGTINPNSKMAKALLECGLLTGKARAAAAFKAHLVQDDHHIDRFLANRFDQMFQVPQ